MKFINSSDYRDIEEPEMREVIARIVALADLDEAQLAEQMSGGAGAEGMLGMELRGLDADSADASLQSWDEVHASSSAALDESQYKNFLRGIERGGVLDIEPYDVHSEEDA